MTVLRPITPADHDFVLELNERNVEVLSAMDESRLEQLLGWCDRGEVIEHEGQRAGFVLTFAPGSGYDADYFRWFGDRYGEAFYYLDRIVIDRSFRRSGLGQRVYDEVEAGATAYGRMVLEVNVEPPNQASLDFHRGRGYAEVEQLGEQKVVAMMCRELRAD